MNDSKQQKYWCDVEQWYCRSSYVSEKYYELYNSVFNHMAQPYIYLKIISNVYIEWVFLQTSVKYPVLYDLQDYHFK